MADRSIQDGRPGRATTRHVFVAAVEPHGPMGSSAVRHAIRKYADAAGLTTSPLGGHILRHSHARRQIELGAPMKVVGDILGHKDPSSTSAYVTVATTRLRSVALPVPRRRVRQAASSVPWPTTHQFSRLQARQRVRLPSAGVHAQELRSVRGGPGLDPFGCRLGATHLRLDRQQEGTQAELGGLRGHCDPAVLPVSTTP